MGGSGIEKDIPAHLCCKMVRFSFCPYERVQFGYCHAEPVIDCSIRLAYKTSNCTVCPIDFCALNNCVDASSSAAFFERGIIILATLIVSPVQWSTLCDCSAHSLQWPSCGGVALSVVNVGCKVRAYACAKIEYVTIHTRTLKNRIRVWYIWYAYSVFEDLCSVAVKYYVIKLPTVRHTFDNNVKIMSFPVWMYE